MYRVVVTGMGVVAPNGCGASAFERALREAVSGIQKSQIMHDRSFACQVAGVPQIDTGSAENVFTEETRMRSNSAMQFAGIAALECWRDAGLVSGDSLEKVDWDTGAIIGTGVGGLDTVGRRLVPMTDAGKVRRIGSTIAEQVMCSGVSAFVGGLLGLGGQVITTSSACCTGSDAVLQAFHVVQSGRLSRVLTGAAEGASEYIWANFDAMRVLSREHNDDPTCASRPLSVSSTGFVPACGAGMLMLESLDSARDRGARIHAEILGGWSNSGGQRAGGSITAANPDGVRRCVQRALELCGVVGEQIDYINGHLTGTNADGGELVNLQQALNVSAHRFPWINATKSLIGHALGAAGAIECVAAILQLRDGFVHESVNCDDLRPDVEPFRPRIPRRCERVELEVAAKVSFGFGDVNTCLVLKRWSR